MPLLNKASHNEHSMPPDTDDEDDLPDIPSDIELSPPVHGLSSWAKDPELSAQLQRQEGGGPGLSWNVFGPIPMYGSLPPSERMSPSPSSQVTPAEPSAAISQEVSYLKMPAKRGLPRSCALNKQSSKDAPNTGLAAQPRRRMKKLNPLHRGGQNIVQHAPKAISCIRLQIETSYKEQYPILLPLLEYCPIVPVVEYSNFNPYRLVPNKSAIFTAAKKEKVVGQSTSIIELLPKHMDDQRYCSLDAGKL
jgi:hypothetical protein